MTLDSPPVSEPPNDSPSQSASIGTPSKSPSAYAIISKGCVTNNLTEVLKGIKAASTNDPQKDQELLSWSVRRAVYNGNNEILRHLLEHEGAHPDRLPPGMVALSASIPILQSLFDHGWDINQSDGALGGGKTLLQYVCGDESLVHWCLDHGASVEDRHPDPYRCPPLLELVAARNTVEIFKLLQSRGAQLGPRTLHYAASAAASHHDGEFQAIRMAMVKYLVDGLGLDVNAMDCEGQWPNHWGTPLCYACRGDDGREVVRFLLDRGADPSIKDCWGIHDALAIAESKKNTQVTEMLRLWMEEKSQQGQGHSL